jgi:hypothetical protein
MASEAGKATWAGIKSLLGWTSDPAVSEIPRKVAVAVETSPEITVRLLDLLNKNEPGTATALVSNIKADGGKVVVASTIVAKTFQM